MQNSFPKNLQKRLDIRSNNGALRKLQNNETLEVPPSIDFQSNDYLSFSKKGLLVSEAQKLLRKYTSQKETTQSGSGGSRLISGNHELYPLCEQMIAKFHNSPAAVIYNSGYDANLGFFSCVPQKQDVIFYDAYIHASVRDGMQLSNAKTYGFAHNDFQNFKNKALRILKKTTGNTYLVIESVYSMDGDSPTLEPFLDFCELHNILVIIDQAHDIGVFGKQGKGLINKKGFEERFFARIITYGKALGAHGAAILCSKLLYTYLINFSRSLIYTTALPKHSLAVIWSGYKQLKSLPETGLQKQLQNNIKHFKTEIQRLAINTYFIKSDSAIHCCVLKDTITVKTISNTLKANGFLVKSVLPPTVPKGLERLRFCLHSSHSSSEISKMLTILASCISNTNS